MQETNGYPDKRPDGPEGRWERDVVGGGWGESSFCAAGEGEGVGVE